VGVTRKASTGAAGPRELVVRPIDAEAFRPFGDVMDRRAAFAHAQAINDGTALRLDDLMRVEASPRGGHVGVSLVRASPRPLPFKLQCLERHRLGTQAFVPLSSPARWLVIVAPGGHRPDISRLRAFSVSGEQGVSYARGTWHHPLVALDAETQFLVVDRIADSGLQDCEVWDIGELEIGLPLMPADA
jgi:ureidoglycolate lyase